MTAKLVPIGLLKDIEATWREASAFSNTANNLIERGLPELRALLAAPATRQYYYRKDGCKAYATTDPDCICWHDEGTGPLFNNPMTTTEPSSWRAKPQSELDVLQEELARERSISAGIQMAANNLQQRLTAAEQLLQEFDSRYNGFDPLHVKVRAALNPIQPAASTICAACDGAGSVSTGIAEASSTICNKCDGTGSKP
jgi:hypothetical protein